MPLFKYLRTISIIVSVSALAVAGNRIDAPTTGKAIKLFNGKNLNGFDTFLRTKGLNNDPDKVFQVEHDMVHISGAEFGYIITKGEYGDYYLRAEFKWGEATHAPREGKARDSGILFHVSGPDKVWPTSVEFQMIEGSTGDIILVDGAAATVKGVHKDKGRFDRFGKGPWQDIAGYRDPAHELEKPHGQWNVLELIADGNTFKYFVNGQLANEATDCNFSRGKILFQSEGAEVYFRNMELRYLKKK